MADQVAQTTEAIIEAVKKKRGGTVSTDDELTSKELYDAYQKALDLLQKIEQGIATEGDKRALAAAKNQLEYYKANTSAHVALKKAKQESLDKQFDTRAKIYTTFINAEQRYNNKVRSTDTKLVFSALDGFSNTVGQDPLIAGFNAVFPADKITGLQKPAIALDSPQYIPTIRAILDGMNEKNNADLFIYTPDGRVDVEASKAAIKNSDEGRNLGGPEFTTIFKFIDRYNQNLTRRIAYDDQRRREALAVEANLGRAQAMAADGDEEGARRLLETLDESAITSQLQFQLEQQLGNPDDLQARVADARMREQSHKFAEEYVEKLRGQIMGGETSDSVRSGIAKGIADPVFRAWAADYGWDRLGRVSMNEDGTPDYSTYVAGGDDIAALLAWERQSKRAAGNYGLKGIDTGEVLRIEFTDGTAITGKRLRRHAADPKGVIRIVTPEGARQVYPGEVERAIYLQRPPPDVTRIDRRAKRIYEREKDQYGRLEMEVMEMGDMEDRADLVQSGDGYLADAEGNFITQDAFAEAQADRLSQTGYHFILSDGKPYFATPDGAVFTVEGADMTLSQVEPEAAKEIIIQAESDPGKREYLYSKDADGTMRLFSAEDFQAALELGKMPEETQVPQFVESPEDKQAISDARDAFVSPEALGLTSTPGPAPFEDVQGSAVIDQYGSVGIDPEDPIPAKPAELPDEPDVETDPVLIEEDKAVDRAVDLQENYPGKTPRTTPRDTGAPGASPRREAGQESYEDRSARLEQERESDKFFDSDNEPSDEVIKAATKDIRQRFRAGKKMKRAERRKMAGKETAKSLQTPEDIAGAMSLDINPEVFAPATGAPEEEETSGDVPEPTGDMGIPQLFGPGSPWAKMMGRRKKKKEERQAKKTKTKDATDDAETSSMLVPGQGEGRTPTKDEPESEVA
jgi:hypothetical protein